MPAMPARCGGCAGCIGPAWPVTQSCCSLSSAAFPTPPPERHCLAARPGHSASDIPCIDVALYRYAIGQQLVRAELIGDEPGSVNLRQRPPDVVVLQLQSRD